MDSAFYNEHNSFYVANAKAINFVAKAYAKKIGVVMAYHPG